MKKVICLMLTLSVVFASLAACAKGTGNTDNQNTSSASQQNGSDSSDQKDDNTTVSQLAVTIDTSVDAQ